MSDEQVPEYENSLTNTRVRAREDIITEIFSRICGGESMNAICKEDGMPSRQSLFTWIAADADIQRRYELALMMRTEIHAEQVIDIADEECTMVKRSKHGDEDDEGEIEVAFDPTAVARNKLRVDARKWHVSKMNPKKYGDKITQEHTGANGGAIRVENMSDEQLMQIAARAGTKAPE